MVLEKYSYKTLKGGGGRESKKKIYIFFPTGAQAFSHLSENISRYKPSPPTERKHTIKPTYLILSCRCDLGVKSMSRHLYSIRGRLRNHTFLT